MTNDSFEARSPAFFAGQRGVKNGAVPRCIDYGEGHCPVQLELDDLKTQTQDFFRDTAGRAVNLLQNGFVVATDRVVDTYIKDGKQNGMPSQRTMTGQMRVTNQARNELSLDIKPDDNGLQSDGLLCPTQHEGTFRENIGHDKKTPICYA